MSAQAGGPVLAARRRPVRVAAGVAIALTALLALAGGASAAGGAGAPALGAGPEVEVLVRGAAGGLERAVAAVQSRGGEVQRRLPVADAALVRLPAARLAALRADHRVEQVTPNARVTLSATGGYDASSDPNSMYSIEQIIGARSGWKYSTGAGVDVALLDSGVAQVPGLDAANKVVHGPDLTPESQDPATRYLDTFGHGTHLAGIIAGHDAGVSPTSSLGNSSGFLGVAPDARVVSVKVADAHGNSDVSQILAGIDWVVQHARDPGLDIRVLNLSFGTDAAQSYVLDPLAHAVEVAWRKGLIVVVSAGNSGAASGRLTNPATDPFVLAVGADDSRQTVGTNDDEIPVFSSRGDGVRNPDLVAPGVHVQSLRVPGSYIDQQHGSTGRLGDRFFRGSGTSQAAAVLSGVCALLVQQRPSITPDQAKALLRSTASELPAADQQAQGAGLVNWRAAVQTRTPLVGAQPWTAATGLGSLDAARGSARLVLDDVMLNGESDIFGQPFDATEHARLALAGTAWSGGTWNRTDWTGSTWTATGSLPTWAAVPWTGKTWAGGLWAGKTWATGTWNGKTWAGGNWADGTWAGSAWASGGWASTAWAQSAWSSAAWW